jgi:phytoene dehydrogenase-like protein
VPVRPWLDIRVAGTPGRLNLISVMVHGVPYHPSGGWTTGRQEELIAGVLQMLEEAAPGVASKVTVARLTTPQEFENEYRLSGGDLMGGALIPSQLLWNRPLPMIADYAMTLDGLYLCGPSVHPGGLLPGQNGANAARALLSKLGKAGGTRG